MLLQLRPGSDKTNLLGKSGDTGSTAMVDLAEPGRPGRTAAVLPADSRRPESSGEPPAPSLDIPTGPPEFTPPGLDVPIGERLSPAASLGYPYRSAGRDRSDVDEGKSGCLRREYRKTRALCQFAVRDVRDGAAFDADP